MAIQRTLLAALLLLAGFGAGRATQPPPPAPIPVAERPESPASLAPTDRACKNELVNVKAQLGICLAYRAPPDTSAATPPPRPPVEMDEETAKLVRTGTTNTEAVLVRTAEGGLRAYAVGGWPPPDGPPAGARILYRKVDGGAELLRDGGREFVSAAAERPMFCPCPRDAADGGP